MSRLSSNQTSFLDGLDYGYVNSQGKTMTSWHQHSHHQCPITCVLQAPTRPGQGGVCGPQPARHRHGERPSRIQPPGGLQQWATGEQSLRKDQRCL